MCTLFVVHGEEVMILVNFVDDTLGGVTKGSSLKPEFLTELRKSFEFEVVEDLKNCWCCGTN